MAKSKNNNINIAIFTALKVSEVSGVPTLLLGNPGCGKSTACYMFASVRGYEVVMLRGNSESPESIMGYDVAPKDVTYDKPMAAIHLRPSWFEEVLRNDAAGKKTLLFLDEITTANEFVQAALLHLVFERKCGKEKLPDSTLIVAAGNYSGNISSSMCLMPPVMNRFMLFNIVPDHSDLDTFLNKYDGAALSEDGKPNNYLEELYETMKKIDSQQVDIPEEHIGKIGELIEKNIKETTRMIMTSGERLIDMSVTELNNIYSDQEDTKLYGFVSFRTLNYLRDVTMAFYECFGKAGITSDNYKNAIDGLCGIGISRDKKTKDVKTSRIGAESYNSMQTTINEIETMKNDKLPKYEKFFINVITSKDESGKTVEKTMFTPEEIVAIVNKVKELKADKDIQTIERPIDPQVVDKVCSITKNSGSSLFKQRVSTTDKISEKIPVEKLAGLVNTWNSIADLIVLIDDVVNDGKFGYKDATIKVVQDTNTSLRSVGFKLRSLKKMLGIENPALEKLIPEIRAISKQ